MELLSPFLILYHRNYTLPPRLCYYTPMKKIILASASPRRRELLSRTGIVFTVETADIDETIDPSKALTEEIQRLAYRKAKAVLDKHPECIIIGSDTIVTIDQKVLGKPKDREDAERMLRVLSGRTHQVYTGLCILSSRREFSYLSINDIVFDELSEQEIEAYVSSDEPYDKAGAYAIQGLASRYITEIHGDFYAIMGLPIHIIYEELKNITDY